MAYDAARTAARSMGAYPVRVVDSWLATTAQGFVALAAARAADTGMDLDGVVGVAEKCIDRCGFVAVLDTLSYLRRSGRVPAIAALAGSALKLYPVVGNQRDGSVGIVAPARGKGAALKRMLREVERRAAGQRLAALAIMHAGAPEQVAELRGAVAAQLQVDELYMVEFSPVMVAHAGPGLIGLAYQVAPPAAGEK
jgi:DegV family protein with EDD domain